MTFQIVSLVLCGIANATSTNYIGLNGAGWKGATK